MKLCDYKEKPKYTQIAYAILTLYIYNNVLIWNKAIFK